MTKLDFLQMPWAKLKAKKWRLADDFKIAGLFVKSGTDIRITGSGRVEESVYVAACHCSFCQQPRRFKLHHSQLEEVK